MKSPKVFKTTEKVAHWDSNQVKSSTKHAGCITPSSKQHPQDDSMTVWKPIPKMHFPEHMEGDVDSLNALRQSLQSARLVSMCWSVFSCATLIERKQACREHKVPFVFQPPSWLRSGGATWILAWKERTVRCFQTLLVGPVAVAIKSKPQRWVWTPSSWSSQEQ